ncbi:MAG: hypothetical protein E7560_01245 [Ruminococcaceae bacterium]|nr:hypothetical protein [Oscillospiraceae bacterium]
MWEIDIKSQLIGLLYFCGLGIAFCLFYDALRALRKVKYFSSNSVFLQDIFYFSVITPITFCFLLSVTNGAPRAYTIIGLIIGFVVCRFTLSIIFLFVFEKVFLIFIRFFHFQKRVLSIIFRKISKLSNKTKEIYKKIFKNVVNRRKKA